MNAEAPPDSGMSLIELVLGLAIASALAMAIAGLLTFSVQARGRMDEATKIEATLVELKVAAQIFSHMAPPDTTLQVQSAPQGTELAFRPVGDFSQPVTFELLASDAGLQISDEAGRIVGPVQLSAFDAVAVEFLSWRGDRLAWLPQSDVGASALMGVRLILARGNRHWPVMLWMARTPVRQ